MKIVIDEHVPYARELFGQFGEVQLLPYTDISCSVLKNVDALIIRSVTKVDDSLLFDSTVKFVGTITSGVDHVDQNYLLHNSIVFASAPGCNAIAVVEYVFSALLYLAKRDNFFLYDKVVGIIGLGNIGSCLYKRLKLLGVSTVLYDPLLKKDDSSKIMNFCSLDKLVSESDIITFHTPLTTHGTYATWHQVDINFLDALSDCCILINTSRGSVIDNSALLHVLQCGKKLNVILDVWENEPNLSLPLLDYVDIGTPHIAGATFEGKIRGVLKIFNAYSIFLGLSQKLDTSIFFPKKTSHFKIFENINQDMLHYLSKYIYDISIDDMDLRRHVQVSNSFDVLRESYLSRREWSSLCIETSDVNNSKLFKDFGFSII